MIFDSVLNWNCNCVICWNTMFRYCDWMVTSVGAPTMRVSNYEERTIK